MSSGLKCLSQVNTLSFSISWRKLASTTLVLVSSLSQSSRHFLYSAFRGAGSFQIPIPLLLLHVPQPNTEQFSPGIMSTDLINVFSYILKVRCRSITEKIQKIKRNVTVETSLRRHFGFMCAGSLSRDLDKID